MTPQEQAEIDQALQEFAEEPGMDLIRAVLQSREHLPQPMLEALEESAGLRPPALDQAFDPAQHQEIAAPAPGPDHGHEPEISQEPQI